MIMWNDTDIPLAYFISFRGYGTWLHGDERGSIDRFNNQFETPYIASNQDWQKYNRDRLKSEPTYLNSQRRIVIRSAILETCSIRKWILHAMNIRTNHVHTVVSIGVKKPEVALNAFKANATRMMRENKLWQFENSPWADKGSKRHLWTEKSIEIAIEYVLNGQGGDLPNFD